MNTYIALFRGINVVGSNLIKMQELKEVLEGNGCVDVQTYIRSGNVIFRSGMSAARLAKRLTAAVSRSHGFEPRVLVLTRDELESVAAGNPFREADENPKSLHLFFLAERPKTPDLKSLEALKAQTERFHLKAAFFICTRQTDSARPNWHNAPSGCLAWMRRLAIGAR
jgi:uncharacterized protein (DUF1697 family)